jgi:hypothetical protein
MLDKASEHTRHVGMSTHDTASSETFRAAKAAARKALRAGGCMTKAHSAAMAVYGERNALTADLAWQAYLAARG